jgi:hypothetical protein
MKFTAYRKERALITFGWFLKLCQGEFTRSQWIFIKLYGKWATPCPTNFLMSILGHPSLFGK